MKAGNFFPEEENLIKPKKIPCNFTGFGKICMNLHVWLFLALNTRCQYKVKNKRSHTNHKEIRFIRIIHQFSLLTVVLFWFSVFAIKVTRDLNSGWGLNPLQLVVEAVGQIILIRELTLHMAKQPHALRCLFHRGAPVHDQYLTAVCFTSWFGAQNTTWFGLENYDGED